MTDAGSAGAPKGLQSAAPIGGRGVSDGNRDLKISSFPPTRRSRRPTRFPPAFRWIFCLHPMYFTIDGASEVLRIRILDASGPRSSKHYANYALWELRIRNLDTSGPISSIHNANHALWELRILILDTSGPILLRIPFPSNRLSQQRNLTSLSALNGLQHSRPSNTAFGIPV